MAHKGRTEFSDAYWTKRDEIKSSSTRGEFMSVKRDGKPCKGVFKELDKKRR